MTDVSADDLVFVARTVIDAEAITIKTRDGKHITFSDHLKSMVNSALKCGIASLEMDVTP